MTTKTNKITSCLIILIMTVQMTVATAFIQTPMIYAADIAGSLESEQPAYVEDEVIVKYKQTSSAMSTSSLEENLDLTSVEEVPVIDAEVMKITSGESVEEVIESLEGSGLVEYAQPNYIYYTESVVPDDYYFNNLWGLHNLNDIDIDAPEAWDYTNGLDEVVVAVIDTGVQITHPDLAGKIWTNPGEIAGDGIDNDGNGYIDDIHGWDFHLGGSNNTVYDDTYDNHGTHVAGTIAAAANSAGVRGVAPNVKIMTVKFLGGSQGTGYTSDAIRAIEYARVKGAKVANASWGSPSSSEDTALNNAIAASGMVFVAAAGNNGTNNDSTPFSPSSLPATNIISVAAVDNVGGLASFSNYGANSVDVGAPGVNILSTYPFSS
ncbi:MAG TPA: S8 family peptidase, partial [Bacilli bacterium]